MIQFSKLSESESEEEEVPKKVEANKILVQELLESEDNFPALLGAKVAGSTKQKPVTKSKAQKKGAQTLGSDTWDNQE